MASPQEPGAGLIHPTRAQLDEMDLLMKKMMALPVGAADDSPETIEQANGPVQIREWADLQTVPEKEIRLPHLMSSFSSPIREPIATMEVDRETPGALFEETIPVPAALRPLVWINAPYDWFFGWLGPVGRFFIGTRGRGLLAWTGLLLIVIGLAWMVAEGLGLDLMELSQ